MIRLIKPYITFHEVEEEFREIFDSGMLTSGIYSKEFPQELCRYTGAKYAFNTTSATTALSMALDVLNIGEDDEVVVSDFSFPATANVVEQRGAIPVFADVHRDTYNIANETLERCITPKTKAVIFVCALGNPTGLHEVKALCKESQIPLVVDAACALGSSEKAVKVGNIADISCFSFHPRKLLTSGEGGAITTSNDEYARKLEIKLRHGAVTSEGKWDFVTYGYNYRLPELQCLMLLKQLKKIDVIVEERLNTWSYYKDQLLTAGMIPQSHAVDVIHNMQSIVFSVPKEVDRDSLILYLKEKEIESTIGTYCLSNCNYYRSKYNKVQKNSLWLEKNTISLPCYHNVDAECVTEEILKYLRKKQVNK